MRPPEQGELRLGTGNVYSGNKNPRRAVRIAAQTGFHSWAWAEGCKIAPILRSRRPYHALTAFGFADMRDANDCVMQVRKSLALRHFSMTQVCDDAAQSKVAHDRTFSMLAYEAPFLGAFHGRPAIVCHIGIHPNWVSGFTSSDVGTVQEYVRSMKALDSMLKFAYQMKWIPVVSGDFNLRQKEKKPWLTSYDVFSDHKLRVKTVGLDGFAWDRRLDLKDWTVIPKTRTGADHPWIVADFKSGRNA